MKKKQPVGYVLCCHEHMQDGHEYWAKEFASIDDALAYINKVVGRSQSNEHNLHFRLFELGPEVPLDKRQEEIPQPAKVATQYRVKP